LRADHRNVTSFNVHWHLISVIRLDIFFFGLFSSFCLDTVTSNGALYLEALGQFRLTNLHLLVIQLIRQYHTTIKSMIHFPIWIYLFFIKTLWKTLAFKQYLNDNINHIIELTDRIIDRTKVVTNDLLERLSFMKRSIKKYSIILYIILYNTISLIQFDSMYIAL